MPTQSAHPFPDIDCLQAVVRAGTGNKLELDDVVVYRREGVPPSDCVRCSI